MVKLDATRKSIPEEHRDEGPLLNPIGGTGSGSVSDYPPSMAAAPLD